MTLLTALPDTLSQVTDAAHNEEGNWIIEHVSDHKIFSIPPVNIGGVNIDFSITTNILMMLIASTLLVIVLTYSASSNKKNKHPKGLANFIELVMLFVKDDIVLPSMGKIGVNFLPFFFTMFFFILTVNLLGLIPFMHTATGNVSITASLASVTFVMMMFHGIKKNGFFGYFKGLIPHGVPLYVLPVMVIIEFLSLLTKPFALCIRLFANMTAGHIVILAFISLIFTLGYVIVPVSIAFSLFIYLLEILVALLQAYIFTILSSLFIGMAIEQEH
ncbi:MAG: F0F1 ATP synthase subunit A [Chlorobi bacterium]|nr:F0F1 ATP synthase subunit A [Chlorobiota bacterium]MCI0715095.1 F0F1 ATP synthase subunit A [Chlorobiota bacterium]